MATAAVAAAAAAAQRRVIESFRISGATSRDGAVAMPAPERRMERKTLERLLRAGVVHAMDDGRGWLDEAALAAYSRKRRARALVLIGGVLAAAAVALGVTLAITSPPRPQSGWGGPVRAPTSRRGGSGGLCP